ncbi:MAG: hypothetical protein IKB08_06185 [Clostridia bacterium]|nr:hypothetical protein [Oscillospiraceae bacterium]MBR2411296.1 hypothetical protein [Clostridia bacterium]
MLNTLIQTIANLGFDSSAITEAFNRVLETIKMGDTSSIAGIMDIFTGVVAAVTGASASDISAIITSLIESVVTILSDDATNSILSVITGA